MNRLLKFLEHWKLWYFLELCRDRFFWARRDETRRDETRWDEIFLDETRRDTRPLRNFSARRDETRYETRYETTIYNFKTVLKQWLYVQVKFNTNIENIAEEWLSELRPSEPQKQLLFGTLATQISSLIGIEHLASRKRSFTFDRTWRSTETSLSQLFEHLITANVPIIKDSERTRVVNKSSFFKIVCQFLK